MIITLQRINLRPAAIRKLSGEDELESLDEPRFTIFAFRGVPHVSEEIHLLRGRAVVERGDVMRFLARLVLRRPLHSRQARAFVVAGVFGPATRRRLIGEY